MSLFASISLLQGTSITLGVILALALVATLMVLRGMKRGGTVPPPFGIKQGLKDFWKAFTVLLGRAREVVLYAALAFRVYVVWPLKKPRRFIHLLVVILFVLGGFVSFVEVLHRLNMGRFLPATHLTAITDFLKKFIEGLLDVIAKGFWVNVALLPIEIAVIVRHLSEFRNPRDPMFWEVYQKLLLRVNGLRAQLVAIGYQLPANPVAQQQQREDKISEFFDAVSKVFRETLERRKMEDICLSLMEVKPVVSPDTLKITFANTGEDQNGKPLRDRIDSNYTLQRGQGASGLALARNCIVYIPSIKTGHAVVMTEQALWEGSGYGLERKIYAKSAQEPFKSMICVPIMNGTTQPVAVLSISSATASAFSSVDFMTAWRAALILSLGVNP